MHVIEYLTVQILLEFAASFTVIISPMTTLLSVFAVFALLQVMHRVICHTSISPIYLKVIQKFTLDLSRRLFDV